MAKNHSENYISVWSWMFILLLAAIPCIGIFVVIIGAFAGSNETRKNYFRALIVWALLIFMVWVFLVALGLSPAIIQQIHQWLQPQHGIKQGTV